MSGITDPQRRPVVYDLRNQRFLADPLIGGSYYPIPSTGLTASDIGVTVQPYNANLLEGSDIGVTVQGYDANTAKLNVNQNWSAAQSLTELRLLDDDASHYIGLRAPTTVPVSFTYTLPPADGLPGQRLVTNGSAQLSWASGVSTAKIYFYSSF